MAINENTVFDREPRLFGQIGIGQGADTGDDRIEGVPAAIPERDTGGIGVRDIRSGPDGHALGFVPLMDEPGDGFGNGTAEETRTGFEEFDIGPGLARGRRQFQADEAAADDADPRSGLE